MADIKTDYAQGLISAWLTDESGLTADLHGSNTLTNNGVSLVTGVNGDAGDYELGEQDYSSITDAAQTGLDLSGDHSIVFWFKPESVPSGDDFRLIMKSSATNGNRAYILRYESTTLTMFINDTGSSFESYSATADLGTGTFKHIIWTWDASASQGQWYVNNSNVGSPTGAKTSIFNSSAPFTIGRRSDEAGGYVDGVMHQVLIYNEIISSSYRSGIYNAGAGVRYEDIGGLTRSPGGGVAYSGVSIY